VCNINWLWLDPGGRLEGRLEFEDSEDMFAAYHQTCQPTIFSSTVSTSRRADALPPTGSVHLVGQDTTGGRGSRVHNRLAVVIGAGSLVVEVATTLAG